MKAYLNQNGRCGRRGGFTVVEILVAITVIAILAAMLIPVVGGAMRRANEFAIQSEMSQLDLAIEHFKSDNGFYPPSFSRLNSVTFLSYLNRIAPNHAYNQANINDWWSNYGQEIAELPGADLVFWLSGIAKNKQYPLGISPLNQPYDNNSGVGFLAGHNFHPGDNQVFERNVYFDFNSERLNFCHSPNPANPNTSEPASYVQAKGKAFDPKQAATFPNDPWKWAAVYLYLDSASYGKVPSGYCKNGATDLTDPRSFFNEDSFQLVAPGLDGEIGKKPSGLGGLLVTDYVYPDPSNPTKLLKGGLDNITNFIGEGSGKLETKALGID